MVHVTAWIFMRSGRQRMNAADRTAEDHESD